MVIYIFTSKYDNLIFLGDFNAAVEDTDIERYICIYIYIYEREPVCVCVTQ